MDPANTRRTLRGLSENDIPLSWGGAAYGLATEVTKKDPARA
jgi:hypothetical protein